MAVPHHASIHSADPGTYALGHPPPGLAERLHEELAKLHSVPGFVSAAVTRRDGLVIAHSMRTAHDAASLCAMAAAMVGASRSTGTELEQGSFLHGVIQFQDGVLVVKDAGPEAILACLLRPDANLGLVLMMASRASEMVEHALAEL